MAERETPKRCARVMVLSCSGWWSSAHILRTTTGGTRLTRSPGCSGSSRSHCKVRAGPCQTLHNARVFWSASGHLLP